MEVPRYARSGDAGCDLLAREPATLAPGGGRALVPTGISLAIPEGYAGFVQPRSGLALRHGVTCLNTPGLIDAGYRGEIKVLLVNTDPSTTYEVERGDRIAQLVVQAVEQVAFVERPSTHRAEPRRFREQRAMNAEALSALDSVFVTMDTANAPLHIGALIELEAPTGATTDPQERFERIKTRIEERLSTIAVLRRRVVRCLDLGQPILVDDPDFDLSFHIVRRAVPAPGSHLEMDALCRASWPRRWRPTGRCGS